MEFDFSKEPGKYVKKRKYDSASRALISIVTPFYNAGQYFQQTFYSVINQTFPWFEWIIVDDGSTEDKDIALLHRLAGQDERIRVITQQNGGLACARNTGIQNTSTEIFVPLDADDLISPQYIEYVYFGLLFNQEASWCYSASVGFGAQEYLWKKSWNAIKMKSDNALVATAAIRKKAWKEIGGYKSERYAYNEDWRFWLEMLAYHKKPVRTGGYLFWYRRTGSSMLSGIKQDSEKIKFNNKIIKTAAEKVDETVTAIEYPKLKSENPYHKPVPFCLGEEYKIKQIYQKIRILMLVPWMVTGGADKFNLEFVLGLDREKYEIGILTTIPSDNEWHQKFEAYTDEIFHLPDFLDSAYYAEFISHYISSREIDIVFLSNSYCGYYLLPWLRKHFPELYIVDYVHMEEWYWKAGGYARISGMMGGFLDKTFVCNSATREVMIQKFERNAASVQTMYIGVDVDEYNKDQVHSGYLYKKFNIPANKEIVLFPCRMHPQKRPFLMLDIAQKVYSKKKNVLFVAVGDGIQLEELKTDIQVRNLQQAVICIGRCDNMKKLYKDARLTLICSLKEGLALTAYESCAMGVPVISSDVGGQRDLIDASVGRLIKTSQDEKSGIDNRKFDTKEVETFADAILMFLEDKQLYDECSRNCRKRIEEKFSTKMMCQNMEKEISALVFNEEILNKHKKMSQVLWSQEKYAEEFYTSYMVMEEREQECEEVWKARCYFESKYLQLKDKKVIKRIEKSNLLLCMKKYVFKMYLKMKGRKGLHPHR
ncbi:MAG: glycosyltransferase [Eubacterium sp.]|nr:glycosyltransferase [Eubacterium sp.]